MEREKGEAVKRRPLTRRALLGRGAALAAAGAFAPAFRIDPASAAATCSPPVSGDFREHRSLQSLGL